VVASFRAYITRISAEVEVFRKRQRRSRKEERGRKEKPPMLSPQEKFLLCLSKLCLAKAGLKLSTIEEGAVEGMILAACAYIKCHQQDTNNVVMPPIDVTVDVGRHHHNKRKSRSPSPKPARRNNSSNSDRAERKRSGKSNKIPQRKHQPDGKRQPVPPFPSSSLPSFATMNPTVTDFNQPENSLEILTSLTQMSSTWFGTLFKGGLGNICSFT
jgi:hypothetical protein